MTDPSTELIPVGVMARRLHVTVRWLRGEAEAGRVPHVKAENTFLFNPEATTRVLAERASRTEVDSCPN